MSIFLQTPNEGPIEINIKFTLDEKESEVQIKNSPVELDSYLFPAIVEVIRKARKKAELPPY